jgi:hypothetical protein
MLPEERGDNVTKRSEESDARSGERDAACCVLSISYYVVKTLTSSTTAVWGGGPIDTINWGAPLLLVY